MALKIDPVAVYAAIVSTAVFCWQIYTWRRSGPRLRGSISSSMVQRGHAYRDDNLYLALSVANVGKADTTITHVILYGFDGWWSYVRGRPIKTAVVNHGLAAYPIPYVLRPGQTFMSLAHQDADLEKWSREMRLYGGVIHSFKKQPLLMRVRAISTSDAEKARNAIKRWA